MEHWVRIRRLTLMASLTVVVASCGSPGERIDAAEAAASEASTSSASGTSAPQSSVPAPVPQTETSSTLPAPQPPPTHAPGPDPPKPQPQPPAPAPAPAPQPQPPAPQPQPPAPPPNPNPPPGTVSYDLPNVPGSDLVDEDNWRSGYRNNCTTAGHPPDCLHMSVEVYVPDANGGNPTRIDDPGPNYGEGGVYDSCPVTDIRPMPPVEVPVGTTVVITVLCQPAGGGAA